MNRFSASEDARRTLQIYVMTLTISLRYSSVDCEVVEKVYYLNCYPFAGPKLQELFRGNFQPRVIITSIFYNTIRMLAW